ncbi:putative secreted protein [Rivibacter subsaxonicus]|uniref:Putative secreted protein n=2 Tax=Rivibacter subsaxonicus TaxID=457575 RepID=A0A4Q7VWP8_9BURK|nr:putative secreted protein [Rivibacter subsaxonicus]
MLGFRSAVLALALFGSGMAQAAVTTVPIAGDVGASTGGSGATFSGLVSYDDSTSVLSVTLRNESPSSLGGYLTAFAFNAPAAASLSFASATLGSFSTFLTGPNTAPFNGFEYGVGVGSPYNGGGAPSAGLSIGAAATWTFNVSGGLFDADDFLSAGGENKSAVFLTRFRGFANGGSDKVPATVVPEPASYALMLAGLAALGFGARRRQR